MRILVTGSRSWTDRDAVWAALDVLLQQYPEEQITVVHGACPQGADLYAAEWVRDLAHTGGFVTEEAHPADWQGHGRSAGFRRNQEMVDAGADLCLTFILRCDSPAPRCARKGSHGTHGSVDCAGRARTAGIPVAHVRPASERAS